MVSIILGALACSGCLDGLRENGIALVNPEESTLTVPGRRLLAGEFESFSLHADRAVGLSLVAQRQLQEGIGFTMAHVGGDSTSGELQACDVKGTYSGWGQFAGPSQLSSTGQEWPYLFYGVTGDLAAATRGLTFFDTDCNLLGEPLVDVQKATLNLWDETQATVVAGDTLYELSVEFQADGSIELKRELLFDDIRDAVPLSLAAVSSFEDEYAYNQAGVLRLSSSLDFAYELSNVSRLESMDQELAIVDGEGLKYFSWWGAQFVGAEACVAHAPGRGRAGLLTFREACGSDELYLYSHDGGVVYSLDSLPGLVIDSWRHSSVIEPSGLIEGHEVFFVLLAQSPDAELGELYAIVSDEPLAQPQEWIGFDEALLEVPAQSVRLVHLASQAARVKDARNEVNVPVELVRDWDGESGELGVVSFDEELEPQWHSVAFNWVASTGIYFEQATTKAYVVAEEGQLDLYLAGAEPELPATRAIEDIYWDLEAGRPWEARYHRYLFTLSNGGVPILSEARGSIARLRIADFEKAEGVLRFVGWQRDLADNVLTGTVGGLFTPSGIIYRTGAPGSDANGVGPLFAYIPEVDLAFSVHSHVAQALSFYEGGGLGYLVPDGEDAGVWWAKAK